MAEISVCLNHAHPERQPSRQHALDAADRALPAPLRLSNLVVSGWIVAVERRAEDLPDWRTISVLLCDLAGISSC
jgi:hypothetical protein